MGVMDVQVPNQLVQDARWSI